MAETVELQGGRQASYEVIGSGEPILMFVGGPGFAASFMRADAELLADGFSCYLVDPHGSGESTPPQSANDYDHLGHARFYDEVRRALSLDAVVVHGESFGGTVALTYAALFPDVVSRCIAVSAFGVGVEVDAQEGGEAADEMEEALFRHSAAPWWPEAREIWDTWTERVLTTNDPEEVRRMLQVVLPLYCAHPEREEVRGRLEEAASYLDIDLGAAKAWEGGLYQTIDLRPLLPEVQAPTLVIAGQEDLIGGPAQARRLTRPMPHAELILLPDCGHMPSWEAPEAYRRVILDWLDAT